MNEVPTLETTPASKIHLIGGEKGGVGKSMVSRLLAQYFIDNEIPFVGYDTDRSHGSLMRFYSDYALPALVDKYEALDRIVESAVEYPGRRVLVDLAAQTHDPLVKWMDESGVLDMADLSGIALHYWHVMDSGRDSVDLLARLLSCVPEDDPARRAAAEAVVYAHAVAAGGGGGGRGDDDGGPPPAAPGSGGGGSGVSRRAARRR